MELVATCLFGLEKLLGEEIDKLGYKRLDTMDGRVTFEGDAGAVARANINLRCAERIFIKVGSFEARTFTDLFEGTKSLPWENYIGRLDAFPVKGHSIKSALFSIPDCQSIVKKAVVNRLGEKYHISYFDETEVKYQIEFFIFKDVATLMIDTTGTALHKRGYRPAAGAAPLRETLGAAIAYTARPREDVLFWDPFCGSGTIAIEAAMILANIAPGAGRSFAAEKFPLIPSALWTEARIESEDKVVRDPKFEVFASDIDREVLEYAKANADRAGVLSNMKIFEQDARKIEKLDRRGTIVCNPPYGERMMTERQVESLYREIGKTFARLSPWQIYVLTSHEGFERFYGRRADKKRKLYNGMIPCNLYQFFKPVDKK
ncbi:MAG: class I SAM-dependent RNA methyltransferase [Clostridia bacterium]|nr:class I SAM-dependent RNA methyltransferase [Clostridia bacterium]